MKFPYNDVLTIQQDYKAGKLTREDATQKLSFLLDFNHQTDQCRDALENPDSPYNQSYGPLLRLSDVCNTLRLWAHTFAHRKSEGDWPGDLRDFSNAWQTIDIAISKSNLLARLFFTEESLRTEPCPVHKGKWSGCFGDDMPGGKGPCPCQSGSNVTGWLAHDPKHADRTYWDEEKKRYKTQDELNPESSKIG